jgi:hypothetical protein
MLDDLEFGLREMQLQQTWRKTYRRSSGSAWKMQLHVAWNGVDMPRLVHSTTLPHPRRIHLNS